MIKSVLKEIIIILLLIFAIILALGVIFYDYIPNNKTIPSVPEYITSETINAELAEKMLQEERVLVTYEITENDLNTYEKKGEYEKGKVNPFSSYAKQTSNNENGDTDVNNQPANENNNNTNNSNGNSSTKDTSKNTFYKNTGTK